MRMERSCYVLVGKYDGETVFLDTNYLFTENICEALKAVNKLTAGFIHDRILKSHNIDLTIMPIKETYELGENNDGTDLEKFKSLLDKTGVKYHTAEHHENIKELGIYPEHLYKNHKGEVGYVSIVFDKDGKLMYFEGGCP